MKIPNTVRSHLLTAAVSMALVVPAFAQTSAPAPQSPSTTTPGTPSGGTTTSPATTGTTTPSTVSNDFFYTEALTPMHWRASEAMGMSVYNKANERIGEIDELVIDGSGKVTAAVVGVGGFLGLGERKVAIPYRSFEMTREGNGNARLVVDLNKSVLQNAPEYKLPALTRTRS